MMRRVIAAAGFSSFAAAVCGRITDPTVPLIAADLRIDPHYVVLLTTGFALPWAITQPILGPVADMVSKTRVMIAFLVILALSSLIGALAPNYSVLLASRILCGVAAAGIMPVSIALVGDLVPVAERQVALGRLVSGAISGSLVGAIGAGLLSGFVGWRGVFWATLLCALAALALAFSVLGKVRTPATGWVSPFRSLQTYARIVKQPRARVCYVGVFLEGTIVLGLLPFIALLLLAQGEGRPAIAGLVLAGFAVGGVTFSATIHFMLRHLQPQQVMIIGGGVVSICFACIAIQPAWPWQLALMTVAGCGFNMLHNGIQMQSTELAPRNRGSAVALHSCFFLLGNAVGPVLYGWSFGVLGTTATLIVGGIVLLVLACVVSELLYGRRQLPPSTA